MLRMCVLTVFTDTHSSAAIRRTGSHLEAVLHHPQGQLSGELVGSGPPHVPLWLACHGQGLGH